MHPTPMDQFFNDSIEEKLFNAQDESQRLQFSYSIINHLPSKITIQLEFAHPKHISLDTHDVLIIDFKDLQFFMSIETTKDFKLNKLNDQLC